MIKTNVLIESPMRCIVRAILAAAARTVMEQNLIGQQIRVYLCWQEKHKGWRLIGEEEWIKRFVKHADVQDVADVTPETTADFFKKIESEYASKHVQKQAKTAVLRLLSFYQARTRAFTDSPRRVTL